MVPGNEPGTEPADSITHTTHRSVHFWKTRGEGAEVVNLPAGGGVGQGAVGYLFFKENVF